MVNENRIYKLSLVGLVCLIFMFMGAGCGKTKDYNKEQVVEDNALVEMEETDNKVPLVNEPKTVPEIHTVTFLLPDGSNDFTVEVSHGEPIGYIPDGNWEDGLLCYWVKKGTGERLKIDAKIYEDTTYSPVYIQLDLFVKNLKSEEELKEVDTQEIRKIAEYIRTLKK